MLMDLSNQPSSFESRQQFLLQNTAKSSDVYGNSAVASLALGQKIAEANAALSFASEWYDHPHPNGRDHRGEVDFTAMKLCRAWYSFGDSGLLAHETVERIQRFYLSYDFQSMYDSENHHLLFHTSRYLMACAFPGETFAAYGKSGRELAELDADWLERFICFRARRGWGEFASSHYIIPDVECLLNLFDFAPSAELARLAGQMITLRLADMAADSLGGMYCGAHGRIYQADALDHRGEASLPLQYLYFDALPQAWLDGRGTLVDALTSRYRPPQVLLDMAAGRREAYESLSRAHLHNTSDVLPSAPLEGSVRRYTYWTPDYVLGCVQYQDPYPEDCPGRWYRHHEQHEWDLSIAEHPDARIFSHHPGKNGNEHGYWTGDLDCACGHFMQSRSALLALYDIPENEPCPYIHAHVPRAAFDEVLEQGGMLFLRKGEVYAALKLLGGMAWASDGPYPDREVVSQGRRNGAVCEMGTRAEHGSFQDFIVEILGNTITFDAQRMVLAYHSRRAGLLEMDTDQSRKIDGKPLDLEYPTYANSYLHSDWDSGLVKLQYAGQQLTLDFRKLE
jgi:hypothetical protein